MDVFTEGFQPCQMISCNVNICNVKWSYLLSALYLYQQLIFFTYDLSLFFFCVSHTLVFIFFHEPSQWKCGTLNLLFKYYWTQLNWKYKPGWKNKSQIRYLLHLFARKYVGLPLQQKSPMIVFFLCGLFRWVDRQTDKKNWTPIQPRWLYQDELGRKTVTTTFTNIGRTTNSINYFLSNPSPD